MHSNQATVLSASCTRVAIGRTRGLSHCGHKSWRETAHSRMYILKSPAICFQDSFQTAVVYLTLLLSALREFRGFFFFNADKNVGRFRRRFLRHFSP